MNRKERKEADAEPEMWSYLSRAERQLSLPLKLSNGLSVRAGGWVDFVFSCLRGCDEGGK